VTAKIRAILIQPKTSGQVDDIGDTPESFRRVLGGYIERVGAADMAISFWRDETASSKHAGQPAGHHPVVAHRSPHDGVRHAQGAGDHHWRPDFSRRNHARADLDNPDLERSSLQ
jgi:hypothetical protein